MLKSDELTEHTMDLKTIQKRDDDLISSCSETHSQELSPPLGKITVEYEPVGSFEVFETICPLEYYGKSTTVQSDMRHRKSKRKSLKGRNSKKYIKTISIADDLTTETGEDLVGYLNPVLMGARERAAPVSVPITFDAFFRSENPKSTEPIGGTATVYWAKGDSAKIPGNRHKGSDTDSDLEADIGSYIKSQKEKKRLGENVTGENLWYDQERSIIRNLHADGSISLTSYGDTNENIFGKTEIFHSIMSCDERAMLQARNVDTSFMRVDKKIYETNKKGKKNRPKGQGDWL
ncbi:unnamed protein product [Allacma fusca]|nr:unnamed protein product [Allacma fusca]